MAAATASWDERIGGVLVAPRRTFARLAAGEARVADVGWLLAGKLVAGYFPDLVRAGSLARDLGAGAGLQALLMVVHELLHDILGISIAGVALSFFVGKEARGYGRTLDLAAYAWIPYLACELGGALYFTARGYLPTSEKQHLVDGIALAWSVIAWTFALVAARLPRVAASAGAGSVT